MQRHYSPLDNMIDRFDHGLRTLFGKPVTTDRAYPAENTPIPKLTKQEQRHAAGLMRVNHAGEVAAQGLYQGQGLTARLPEVKEQMREAAIEENDHLDWCAKRLDELNSHTSVLGPVWYGGSFIIGAVAGAIGDKWSLGFVAETEHQVMAHLDKHLKKLPQQDQRSRKIIEQMHTDEAHHAETAIGAGAAELPTPIKKVMGIVSKIMTFSAYRI
ncbi:MAG: demethoxyubiquinone hydroxylase family protein [Legionellales bacterium]|nr:demethoxyubiquinone hydroxylase family protein [Legionellales bacterium]|tara:strand:+ start:2351 stop:2992 length:642 start_codon:yes stop_codon:yes gene_type:complete